MVKSLTAPCGMDCSLCAFHQREGTKRQRHCEGCRGAPSGACGRCEIRKCPGLPSLEAGFCFECAEFPCCRLRRLDARYRERYGRGVLENLEEIRWDGLAAFEAREKERWACPNCGKLLCIHHPACPHCGAARREMPNR